MKKLLSIMTGLVLSVGTVSSIGINVIKNNNMSNNSQSNSKTSLAKTYQTATDWVQSVKNSSTMNEITTRNSDLSGYHISDIQVYPVTISDGKSNNNLIEANYTLNGGITSYGATPTTINQHEIDNTNGVAPITISYDSFSSSVTTTTTVTSSSSWSVSGSLSINTKISFGIPFIDDNSVSIGFNVSKSNSGSESKTQSNTNTIQETFDKFSTTIPVGDKETINYVILAAQEKAEMNAQSTVDNNNSYIEFTNGSHILYLTFNDIINGTSGYPLTANKLDKNANTNTPALVGLGDIFGQMLMSVSHLGTDVGFLGINQINSPSGLSYNMDSIYFNNNFYMSCQGFTALITPEKVK